MTTIPDRWIWSPNRAVAFASPAGISLPPDLRAKITDRINNATIPVAKTLTVPGPDPTDGPATAAIYTGPDGQWWAVDADLTRHLNSHKVLAEPGGGHTGMQVGALIAYDAVGVSVLVMSLRIRDDEWIDRVTAQLAARSQRDDIIVRGNTISDLPARGATG